jgi:hypothetical protein
MRKSKFHTIMSESTLVGFVIPRVVLAKIIVSLMESGTCGDLTGVCDPFLLDLTRGYCYSIVIDLV